MMPIINLMLPDNDQLNSTNFYACYEFIIYEKRELERSKLKIPIYLVTKLNKI